MENEIKIIENEPKPNGDRFHISALVFGAFMLLLIGLAFLPFHQGFKILALIIGSFILLDLFRSHKKS